MERLRNRHLDLLFEKRPDLVYCKEAICLAEELLYSSIKSGGKVLICGNGGSACDAEHIAGELMKSFLKKRRVIDNHQLVGRLIGVDHEIGEELANRLEYGIPAISLVSQSAIMTAVSNDTSGDMVFAQQAFALGRPGDVLWCISTSGNSRNVVYAAVTGKAAGLKILAMTGRGGGRLVKYCDTLLDVPYTDTAMVQEAHLPIYHTICAMLEERFYG